MTTILQRQSLAVSAMLVTLACSPRADVIAWSGPPPTMKGVIGTCRSQGDRTQAQLVVTARASCVTAPGKLRLIVRDARDAVLLDETRPEWLTSSVSTILSDPFRRPNAESGKILEVFISAPCDGRGKAFGGFQCSL